MRPLQIYVAASYCRIKEATEIANILTDTGILVTSDWHVREGTGYGKAGESEHHALIDQYEIVQSHLLYSLSEEPNASKGGRLVEVGMALAMSRPVIVEGAFDNIFSNHPLVFQFDRRENAFEFLLKLRTVPGLYEATIAKGVMKLHKVKSRVADPSLQVLTNWTKIMEKHCTTAGSS